MRREQLTKLRQILVDRFSESELQDLYFDLGIGYATLTSKGKADKARELVKHCERHNRIQELVETGRQLRPDIPWEEIIQETTRDEIENLLAIAQALLNEGHLDQAVELLTRVRKDHPDSEDLKRLYLEALYRKGVRFYITEYNLPQARHAFRELLDVDPYYKDAARLLHEVEQRLGRELLWTTRVRTWWQSQSDAVKAAYIGLLGTLVVAFCGLFSSIPGKALDVLLGREGTKVAMLTPTPTNTLTPTPTPTSTPTSTPTNTPTPTFTNTPTPSYTPTPTPNVEETLLSLIEIEKEAVLTPDIDLIKTIFAPDGTKTDAAIPKSWNAIQRYTETLTTEDYLEITHTNFDFTINGDEAIVTNDSCGSFIIVATGQRIDFNCPQCDRWTFHRDVDGQWRIADFTYGLVSSAPSHRYTFEDGTNGCWTVRYESGQPQGQIPTHTTELAYQGQGSIRFAFDLRGQTIRYNMPFAGEASAYIYASPDAPTDLVAGFFAMELDHAPWNKHDADQIVQLTPGQWTRITWNVDASSWVQPLHLFGIEVRRASGGSYNGHVLIDDVLIQSRQ